MSTKAHAVQGGSIIADPFSKESSVPAEDLFFFVLPGITYKLISDEASRRNMTFAQALQQALNQWLERK